MSATWEKACGKLPSVDRWRRRTPRRRARAARRPATTLHQFTGPLLLADDRQRGHEPERADEEVPSFARHAVVSLAGAVAQHETVFCQLVGDGPQKGTTRVWDDEHLVFCDLMSPRTVENLRTNRAVEVNVVDPIARRGYRFKGSAQSSEKVHSSSGFWRSIRAGNRQ
jgi:Pyridoxamine 5'-phosphate oxidase